MGVATTTTTNIRSQVAFRKHDILHNHAMNDHLLLLNKLSNTLVASIFIPVAILLMLWIFSRRRQKGPTRPIICLPCTYWETIQQLASSQAPWFLLDGAKKIGFVYRIRIPDPEHFTFVVGDPVLAREILMDATATKPFRVYGSAEAITGASNLFSSNGERWRHARKSIAPAFSTSHIKRMNQVCSSKVESWIQNRLNVFIDNDQAFDPAQEMIGLTLSIICESAFEYEMKQDEATFFVQELNEALREFMLRQLHNPLRKLRLVQWLYHGQIQRAKQAAKNVQAVAQKILETYRNKSNTNHSTGTVIECIDRNDEYANDQERIADILVFLVGGHDTTAYSLAWTLLEVAQHPQEVRRIRNELQPLSPDERGTAPAIRNFVREAMRLHPVGAMGSVRQVHRNVNVHNDPTSIIPKGSLVLLPQLLLNQNPLCFEQPDLFLPDRWSNNSSSTSGALAFMPFSVGSRNCVGQALADAELHSVLSSLVMNYDFQVIDAGHADYFLTLKPSGVSLKATRRC
jgi:cytochrome P450